MNFWYSFLAIVVLVMLLLPTAAMLVWVERRLLGFWQERLGPNRVGPYGILQSLADLIKILFKHDWIPPFADAKVFVAAPLMGALAVMMSYAVVPMAPGWVISDSHIGLLFFLAMTSLAVYSVLLAGWSSNNKYALIGAMRAAAQTISYEVFMGLSLLGVVMLAGSFRLSDIVLAQQEGWFILPQCLGFVLFLIAGIAESHRLPFDLPEAETELTAGFHTEYSGIKFALFFLGEYLGVMLISMMITVLFLGGWLAPFGLEGFIPPIIWFVLKTFVLISFFILLRAALPRPRFDQLLAFGWLWMLPLSLINLLVTAALILGGQ
ncbi:NADH-quinone oxidoreductase subunit NuoH [Aliiglaciecola sp. CAU 1673]|uniref:NADH-quinone oxidoreductase subunit NuoH n=1 Tax=Aliiglaciecola sp. CAU 1673 TaxID=3032595 RepID=UPI0023DA426A|nr:NADH-quinone oxidoreductase subunit NuoH [Aliiglaciecola sp. CAU 1673]MDF2176653.1 NADH-quinone oxidoreductase subunit NuoH [Aliiglaciecola sp. CAU 1673]